MMRLHRQGPGWLRGARRFAAACLILASSPTWAYGVSVCAGCNLSLGDGNLTLGCGDLVVGGQLSIASGSAAGIGNVTILGGSVSGGAGSISLSGDWANSGAFVGGTGVVAVVDGCGTNSSALSGDTTFNEFSMVSVTGKLLSLAAGSTQSFAGGLVLQGIVGNLLRIRSTLPGIQAFFSLGNGASQTVIAVDVADNNAQGGEPIAPGVPADFQSVDSGNNDNWFIDLLDVMFRDGFES